MAKKIIYFSLTILLCIGAYMLGFYLFKPDKVVLDDVSLKDIEAKEENKGMAIMLGDKLGNYSASPESGFPSNLIYKYNSEKSGCIDVNGITVEGVLSYDDASSTASLNTGTTVSCYLYFDIDKEAPSSNSILISNNATYTNSANVTLTLSSSGASHMCISENGSSCTNYVDYNTSSSFTLSSGDGTKTVYVTYKDYADNISEVASDSIILDTTAPVINSISDAGDGKISYTVTENLSGVSHYCVQTTNTSSGCNWVSISNGNQTTGVVTEEDGTFYLFLKDSAGNISASKSVELSVKKYFGKYLLANALKGKTAYSGLYRYTGTSANNYVNMGGVLYRVIGVTSAANSTLGLEANQAKLIKATTIEGFKWHSSYTVDARWNVSGYTNCDMYLHLNDLDNDTTNQVLNNTSIIPNGWKDKITSVKWYVGDVNIYPLPNASTIFGYEDNNVTQSFSKVGLMYISDMYFAYEGENQQCYGVSSCPSWITQGTPSNSFEWTMSRYGYDSYYGYYEVWRVYSVGQGNSDRLNSAYYELRPVIYLNADVVYTGTGDGSSGSPYVIS